MAKTSTFFRIGVAGATVDGRIIEPKWLEDMAATYNPATYGARINCEHVRGYSPEKPFHAYGDVIALKTETIDLDIGGKSEKRLALFAQIVPTDELVQLSQARQKLYTSMEVGPKFAGTDKAYLLGLAITDTPASLGTDRLTFAASAKGNIFSPALETTVEMETVDADPTGIFASIKGLIAQFKPPEAPITPPVTPPVPANDAAEFAKLSAAIAAIPATLEAMAKASNEGVTALRTELTALQTKLAATDGSFRRAPAPGGAGNTQTDC